MTIRAADGLVNKPTIRTSVGDSTRQFFEVWADFTIEGVILEGLRSDGTLNPFEGKDAIGIVPHPDGSLPRHDITIKDCDFRNMSENGDPENDSKGGAFRIRDGALAGNLLFEDCLFENIIDEAILMQKVSGAAPFAEKVADTVWVKNSTFINCAGPANQGVFTIKGDEDTTTVDAKIIMENLFFYNSGPKCIYSRESENMEVRNILISHTNPNGSNGSLIRTDRNGSIISNIDTFAISALDADAFKADAGSNTGAGMGTVDEATIYGFDPDYTDAANGNYEVNSPYLYFRSSSGGFIGDLRWATNPPAAGTDPQTKPMGFTLSQNYPNPFNPSTSISFTLEAESIVNLVVYDLNVSELATLVQGTRPSGSYSVTWTGSETASGLYVYTLTTNGQSISKKMLLLK